MGDGRWPWWSGLVYMYKNQVFIIIWESWLTKATQTHTHMHTHTNTHTQTHTHTHTHVRTHTQTLTDVEIQSLADSLGSTTGV